MKIKAVRSSLRNIPLKKPYTIASHSFAEVTIAFLEIELANGIIGYGSGSPAEELVGETSEMTFTNLQSDFIQRMKGRDIRHFQQLIYNARQYFNGLPGTQATIDIALHDAFCKWAGMRVVDYFGQKMNSLPTSVTIGIKDAAATLIEANEYVKQGFRVLKVKLGSDPREDIERILKLNKKFRESIVIRVDVNQGYDLLSLIKFIDATAHVPVELIEQPLPIGAEKSLLSLPEAVRKKLVADESLIDPAAALEWASKERCFGIYNIKLMKCGGIAAASEIATIAAPAGIDLFWGCNDESIISITAALHLAYSCPHTKYIDLDGSFDLTQDNVGGGFRIKNGHLYLTEDPGLGVRMM